MWLLSLGPGFSRGTVFPLMAAFEFNELIGILRYRGDKCRRNNELGGRQRKGKSKMSAAWKRHFHVYLKPSGLFIPRFRSVSLH